MKTKILSFFASRASKERGQNFVQDVEMISSLHMIYNRVGSQDNILMEHPGSTRRYIHIEARPRMK
jgi:hypothetical protein